MIECIQNYLLKKLRRPKYKYIERKAGCITYYCNGTHQKVYTTVSEAVYLVLKIKSGNRFIRAWGWDRITFLYRTQDVVDELSRLSQEMRFYDKEKGPE